MIDDEDELDVAEQDDVDDVDDVVEPGGDGCEMAGGSRFSSSKAASKLSFFLDDDLLFSTMALRPLPAFTHSLMLASAR